MDERDDDAGGEPTATDMVEQLHQIKHRQDDNTPLFPVIAASAGTFSAHSCTLF